MAAFSQISARRSFSQNPFVKLKDRGLIQQVSSQKLYEQNIEDIKLSNSCNRDGKKPSMYIGFDPTAESIHLGNYLGLLVLTHIRMSGHFKPIVLFGGATGLIGDPSGRSTERSLLSKSQVDQNIEKFKNQFDQLNKNMELVLIKNGMINGDHEAIDPVEYVNNYDFYKDMGSLEFLRDVGKHFRVSTMLSRDSVKSRLSSGSASGEPDEGMSFTEFTYQVLQGYDFYKLHHSQNCYLQLGGSDQWGNITSGIDYVRRTYVNNSDFVMETAGGAPTRSPEVFGLTIPLLVDSQGNKYGKTMENGQALWLDSTKTSVFDFYQFFINMADAEVEDLLKKLTFLNLEEIEQIMKEHELKAELRLAQKTLAKCVTELIHGIEEAQKAEEKTQQLFSRSKKQILEMTLHEFTDHYSSVQMVQLSKSVLQQLDFVSLIVHPQVKLRGTKADARRLLSQGGFKINDKVIKENRAINAEQDLLHGEYMHVRAGKKSQQIIRIFEE